MSPGPVTFTPHARPLRTVSEGFYKIKMFYSAKKADTLSECHKRPKYNLGQESPLATGKEELVRGDVLHRFLPWSTQSASSAGSVRFAQAALPSRPRRSVREFHIPEICFLLSGDALTTRRYAASSSRFKMNRRGSLMENPLKRPPPQYDRRQLKMMGKMKADFGAISLHHSRNHSPSYIPHGLPSDRKQSYIGTWLRHCQLDGQTRKQHQRRAIPLVPAYSAVGVGCWMSLLNEPCLNLL